MDGSEVSQCQSTSSHVSQGLKYLGWLKPFRHSNIQFKGGTKQCPEEKVLRKERVPKIIQTFGPFTIAQRTAETLHCSCGPQDGRLNLVAFELSKYVIAPPVLP